MSRQRCVIIFDWDGTLMDSQAHITECMHAAVSECQFTPLSDTQIAAIIGLGLERAFATLYPNASEADVIALSEAYRRHFFLNEELPSPLFDGAANLIDALHQQGHWLAIATGKSRRGLNKALGQSGLEAYFHITRTADETASKPDPLMLHEILTDLDSRRESAVMIGDSRFDIEMAGHARMYSLGVDWGTQNATALRQAGAAEVATNWQELSDYLQHFIERQS